jgi:hypothetical protein
MARRFPDVEFATLPGQVSLSFPDVESAAGARRDLVREGRFVIREPLGG